MPKLSAASLDKIRTRLRDAGLRSTAARLWVMQELIEATSPVTHGEVAEALATKGFDRATIYRNLVELTEAGRLLQQEAGRLLAEFSGMQERMRDFVHGRRGRIVVGFTTSASAHAFSARSRS